MILLIECIGLWLLFFILVVISYKINPLAGLHNLPLEIQKRVQKLPEYKKWILKKFYQQKKE